MASLLGANLAALGNAYAQVAPSIERVSIGDSGQQQVPNIVTVANGRVSFNGDRVLFGSLESMVSDDMNEAPDGFVRIRSSQTTERVTFQVDGSEVIASPNGLLLADMSSNGKFVAFSVSDSGPVGADFNPNSELFVRDVVTGDTEVVSLTPEGLSATDAGRLDDAVVSDDGNIVAFVSSAIDQLPGDRNGVRPDVYVHDRSTGETIRLWAPGTPRWWGGDEPDITPDGRFVVYEAYESIYRADLWAGEYELVSVDLVRRPGDGPDDARDPVISADGRFVAYEVVSGFPTQVLLRDMTQERPVFVTAGPDPDGLFPNGGASPSIIADGRFITFFSGGTNFGPDVSGGDGSYVYLFDAADGSISLASRDGDGKPITGIVRSAQISGDGSTVVFTSVASDLVPGDTNGLRDMFAVSLTTERCAGMLATIAGSGEIIGTDGDDVILASAGPDTIDTGAGDDIICALGGGDIIDAGAGNDVVYAGSGNDTIYAGNGRDLVFGGKDDDIVNAGAGNDRAFGGPGIDIIRGNEGADRLSGGTGDDTLIGGPGADRLVGGDDADICKGSAGSDRYFLCEERLP